MSRRHVLIGSGPASVMAAQTIRGLDAGAQIVIVGAEREGYYSRPGLAYYLANEVPEAALYPFRAGDFAELGVNLVHDRAVHIAPAEHRVTLESGRELAYDRLLLATGSRAVSAKLPGTDLDGVTKLDDMADAHDLIRRSRRAEAAVVIGGGITALEIVEGLRARRVRVHYFMRKDRYWSNVLSESESHRVEQALRAQGVEVHPSTQLAAILGRDGRVVGVETTDGRQIDCGLVAVALGVLPQTELAREAGLACGRGVLVDRFLRSSDDDIFAAGDLAEVLDPQTDERTVEVLWNSAVAKGRVAGRNMAGEATHAYEETAPLNVTRLAGTKLTIMGAVGSGTDSDQQGVARGGSENWPRLGRQTIVETQVRDAHVRLALGETTIVGAVVMGDQALSFPLQEIIAARADVADIMAHLRAPSASFTEVIAEFWREERGRLG